MDIFSENGLFFESNERLKNGRNVAVIQIGEGFGKIKVRYNNLPTGELNLSNFAAKFFAVALAFDVDDAAVRIYMYRKKNKQPGSLLAAINDAKVTKHNMLRVGNTLLDLQSKCNK